MQHNIQAIIRHRSQERQPWIEIAIGTGVLGGGGLMSIPAFLGMPLIITGIVAILICLLKPLESEVPPLEKSIKESRVVWGMWHSGDRIRNEKLFDLGVISRVLLPEPNEGNQALQRVVAIAGEDMGTIINQIKATTKAAKQQGVEVRWHKEFMQLAITLYDNEPQLIDSVPFSPKAWVSVQILDPLVPRQERQLYSVKNKKEPKKFMGYKDLFEDIWDNRTREPRVEEYD